MKLLLIDNYDSFTYNLFQLFGELGTDQIVRRNDALVSADVARIAPDAIVISPGPGRPADSGVSRAVLSAWGGRVPILGVCLGMQCISDVFGGKVIRAEKVMHGKTSQIIHDGTEIFEGVPSPCSVARYHSLVVSDLPDCLVATSHTEDGVIMSLRHVDAPIWGVQFHPESFMSEYGKQMMQNFLDRAKEANDGNAKGRNVVSTSSSLRRLKTKDQRRETTSGEVFSHSFKTFNILDNNGMNETNARESGLR